VTTTAPPGGTGPGLATTLVVATRNRRGRLLETLEEVDRQDPELPVIVVDNASADGTAAAVRRRFPHVQVIALDGNEGAAARNIGAATASTPLVAFNDDDSTWVHGSLVQAAKTFARHPRLGLLAARVEVGAERRLDATSAAMAASPLVDRDRSDPLPGTAVLGFLACAAIVRRRPFLDVGGFSRILFFGGEEELLALDLAAAGWAVRYDERLVVHHVAEPGGRDHDGPARRALQRRNALLTAWMRRPPAVVARAVAGEVRAAARDSTARTALREALPRLPAAHRARRMLPPQVEDDVRLLEWQRRCPPVR
jgi:GT2 family glycosyltransferase